MPKGFLSIFSPSFSHISKFVMAFGTALVWKKHPVWIWKLCSTCVPIIFLNILLHWASKTRKSTFSYTCSITTPDNIGATNSRRALSKTIHFYSFETKSKGKDTSEWRVKVRISSAPHAYRDNASANKKIINFQYDLYAWYSVKSWFLNWFWRNTSVYVFQFIVITAVTYLLGFFLHNVRFEFNRNSATLYIYYTTVYPSRYLATKNFLFFE